MCECVVSKGTRVNGERVRKQKRGKRKLVSGRVDMAKSEKRGSE